ncbi:MAG: efflux RND transporter permease subunit [Sandaracinaceae bacterium]
MSAEQKETPTFWERFIGWFVDRKFVVFVLAGMMIAAGVYVSPFGWDLGSMPSDPLPVDAIPDIGENQQIVFTEWAGRSPRDVEDQITYPLTTALLGIPGVRTVRSSSAFGFSTIYVIFDDSVDFYWSRSRVLEKLASLPPGTVPDGVTPTLGPDATALGQVFWYTLEGHDPEGNVVGGWDQHELRSIQDWVVRYSLQSVEGVSEVASIGGYVREYQVDVDPEAMRAHGVSLMQVAAAVRESNLDVGARTIEVNRVEYLVRGLGFIERARELEEAVIATREHTPIRVRDVARVTLGPANRRGALDDGGAPAVGGVVVARYMENPLRVIHRVKDRIDEIAVGLPQRTLEDGTVSQVTIVPFYDRTELIHETLDTLSTALWQAILITTIVVLVLLGDMRSSLLISSMLPLGVLAAFVVMKQAGVDANIMALGGIAIAIGTMVDMGIVFTENIALRLGEHEKKERESPESWGYRSAPGAEPQTEHERRGSVVKKAAGEVAPAVVTSVLTTVVSFLPVFGLTASEARLFSPLAYTKTFAMLGALGLSLLVLPAVAHVVLRRRPDAAKSGPRSVASVVRGLFASTQIRNWVLLAAAVALCFWSLPAGLVVVALALFRFARPFLPERALKRASLFELVVVVCAVTLALADDWLPLGRESGGFANALFVAAVVASVLGTFWVFARVYGRFLAVFLRWKKTFLLAPVMVVVVGLSAWLGFETFVGWLPDSIRLSRPVVATTHAFPGFGREYMPPFDEGSFLYMPTTMPHASFGSALEMLSEMDAAIQAIPEVERCVGKLGRAESALDPAPVSMIETIITYVPEYRIEEDGTRVRQWRDHIRTPQDIWDEIIAAAERPGVTSAPVLMPINARIVMLQSGMRAPMGIKVAGPTLEAIEVFGLRLEELLREVPSVRAETVFADRVVGKPYLEIDIDRESISRYGLSIREVQNVLQVALGGMTLSRTVEGRERYPIRVRYMREERDSVEAIRRLSIPTPGGEQIPLEQLAEFRYVRGPQVIKSEDTFLTSYVLFDRQQDVAEVEVVEEARAFIEEQIANGNLEVPAGVSYRFAGSYENQVRSEQRLMVLIPIALALVFVLLYLQFNRVRTAFIIYSGVAVAVCGGFLLIWLYGQDWFMAFEVAGSSMRELFQVRTVNMSVAVWVGVIALVGVATDDGVVMATLLKQRFEGKEPRPTTVEEIRERVLQVGRRRIRPCLMTTATTILALLPVITSQGRGSDVMVPMALPSVGGMSIELLTLFVVPVLYCMAEERRLKRRQSASGPALEPQEELSGPPEILEKENDDDSVE